MRGLLKFILNILIGLLLALGAHSRELPPELQHLEDSDVTRFGFEVEVILPSLENMVHLFDFNALKDNFGPESFKSNFPADSFDKFLTHNSNLFWSLPEELRAQLSEGLDLEPTQLQVAKSLDELDVSTPAEWNNNSEVVTTEKPAVYSNSTEIILPNGAPARSEINLKVPEQAKKENRSPGELKLSRHQQHERDWNIVFRRWAELPLKEKMKAADWNHLSRPLRAEIFDLWTRQGRIVPVSFYAPEDIKKTLSKMNWSPDGAAIEFGYRLENPVISLAEYYRDMMVFSKYLGHRARLKILDPENLQVHGYSFGDYHVHFSNPPNQGPKWLSVGHLLNKWLLFKRLNYKIVSDIEAGGQYTYKEDPTDRGLLRVYNDQHFEVRTNSIPFDELLAFVVPLTRMSTEEAQAVLEYEINQLLTEETVEFIAKHNIEFFDEFLYLADLDHKLNDKLKEILKIRQEIQDVRNNPEKAFNTSEYQNHVLNHHPEYTKIFFRLLLGSATKFWPQYKDLVAKIMNSGDNKLIGNMLSRIADTNNRELYSLINKKLPSLLTHEDSQVGASVYLENHQKWDKETWKAILKSMKNQKFVKESSILSSLYYYGCRGSFPKELWDLLGQLYFDEDFYESLTYFKKRFFNWILQDNKIPLIFVRHINNALNSSNDVLVERAQKAIEANSWSKALKAEVLAAKACDFFFN